MISRMFNLFFFWGYPDTPFIKVPGSNSDVFRPHWSRWFNRARIVQYVSPWSSLCDIDLCWINAPWNQRCPTVYSEKKIKPSNVIIWKSTHALWGDKQRLVMFLFWYFKLLSCEWWIAGECWWCFELTFHMWQILLSGISKHGKQPTFTPISNWRSTNGKILVVFRPGSLGFQSPESQTTRAPKHQFNN